MLPSSSLRRRLCLAVAVLLLLGAVACDDDAPAQTARQDVQQAYGVDTHDSNQVGGAIASGDTLGNKEASGGLTILRNSKLAEQEQRGDFMADSLLTVDQAIGAYKGALRWNKPPLPKDAGLRATLAYDFGSAFGKGAPGVSARLHGKLGKAYGLKGDKRAEKDAYLAAAREYERAAQATPDAGFRDSYLKSADLYRRVASANLPP